jgi:membrane fusion protein, multidrug efflux system
MAELNNTEAMQKTTGNGIRKRHVSLVVVIVVVVLTAIFGSRWLIYNRTHETTDDAQVDATIYPINARVSGHVLRVHISTNQPVKAGDLLVELDPAPYRIALEQAEANLIQAEGAAGAATGTVNVSTQTGTSAIDQANAQVASTRASETISARQSDSADEQITAAQADAAAAGAAVDVAQRVVKAVQATLISAQAHAEQAQKDAARIESLADSGAASMQQRDAAQATATSALAAVEAAQAQVESAQAALLQARERYRAATINISQAKQRAAAARAQIDQSRASISQAQAALHSAQVSPVQTGVRRSEAISAGGKVAQARAAVEQAKLNLAYTRIYAPANGVIAQKNVQPGQEVQAAQSLAAVVVGDSTKIVANFKETQLGRIREKQHATFTVDAYPRITFSGHVLSLSPGTGSIFSLLPPENASGNFTKTVQRIPVKISVDKNDPQHPLRAGMSVVVSVATK